jgi:hypothetical protein
MPFFARSNTLEKSSSRLLKKAASTKKVEAKVEITRV